MSKLRDTMKQALRHAQRLMPPAARTRDIRIIVRTDLQHVSESIARELRRRLRISVVSQEMLLDSGVVPGITFPDPDESGLPSDLRNRIIDLTEAHVGELLGEPATVPVHERGGEGLVVIELPLRAVAEAETLEQRRAAWVRALAPVATICWRIAGLDTMPEEVAEKLRACEDGLGVIARQTDDDDAVSYHGAIFYGGGVPTGVPDLIAASLAEHLEVRTRAEKKWPSPTDRDVWIFIDPSALIQGQPPCYEPSWRPPVRRVRRPFLLRAGRVLHVGQTSLPINAKPFARKSAASFEHYVIDEPTAELMERVAHAITCCEPALIIGETGTSKSSGVAFLAEATRTPLITVSLSADTEVSDLLGRWVPAPGLDLRVEELAEVRDGLTPRSRRILERALAEDRQLRPVEMRLIEGTERIGRNWHWLDGPVVRTLRQGTWLLLDELNLCPAPVIERLNPLLERDGVLALPEHDHEIIIPERGFRIIATANPSSYAGRARISPALLARLTTIRARPPGLREFEALTRALVEGRGTKVTVLGLAYEVAAHSRVLPALAALPAPQRERLVSGMAQLHGSVASALTDAADTGISRRTLIRCLHALDAAVADGIPLRTAILRVIDLYYTPLLQGLDCTQQRETIDRIIETIPAMLDLVRSGSTADGESPKLGEVTTKA